MPKGENWLYWILGAFIGYEMFLNTTSPIYYQTLLATLSSAASVASGASTNVPVSTTINAYSNLIGPYSPDLSTPTGSTAAATLGPGNTSIEDIPMTYYANLVVPAGPSGYYGSTTV
jgi:hypothetical protein